MEAGAAWIPIRDLLVINFVILSGLEIIHEMSTHYGFIGPMLMVSEIKFIYKQTDILYAAALPLRAGPLSFQRV